MEKNPLYSNVFQQPLPFGSTALLHVFDAPGLFKKLVCAILRRSLRTQPRLCLWRILANLLHCLPLIMSQQDLPYPSCFAWLKGPEAMNSRLRLLIHVSFQATQLFPMRAPNCSCVHCVFGQACPHCACPTLHLWEPRAARHRHRCAGSTAKMLVLLDLHHHVVPCNAIWFFTQKEQCCQRQILYKSTLGSNRRHDSVLTPFTNFFISERELLNTCILQHQSNLSIILLQLCCYLLQFNPL
mmetsp:Transcript_15245/g.24233  ORF Transcript_15245/g.24233 Transcript_15245/m.24233 type:complete len:241 (-) Transcript_15245:1314-2036(-)